MPEEEINTDELNLNQKVEILMGELPRPVQDFLRSPERDQVSLELSTKYNLHADQAGVFSRAYIYMLLGVYTPEEFVQELRDAGIAEATVQGLTQDVNERVFKRLQNAERTSSMPTAPQVIPASQPTATPAPQPIPAATPTPQPPTSAVPPAPAPFAPVPQAMPASAPIYVSPEAAQPAIRTMAHDMQVLKEEEKHPHQAAPAHESVPPAVAPQPISWQPSSPARSFQTSSVPNTLAASSMQPAPTGLSQAQSMAPQAPMPVFHAPTPQQAAPTPAHPPIPAPNAPVPHNLPTQPAAYPWQSQSTTAPAAPSPTQRPQMPIIKEYSVDPYRETPE